MTTEWMALQLIQVAPTPKPPRRGPPFNPRPAGQLQPGSAAEAVLYFMTRHRGRFFTHSELMLHTQRTSKAICWAVAFLSSTGRIEASNSDPRNPRYRRYRVPRQLPIEE